MKESLKVYIHSKFTNSFRATIGADFISKTVQMGDRQVSIQIWDTAGQERFLSLSSAFYRGADACILVYDVTKPESFHNLTTWIHNFIQNSNITQPEKFPFYIIGNKIDLVEQRKITRHLGIKGSFYIKQLSLEIARDYYVNNGISVPLQLKSKINLISGTKERIGKVEATMNRQRNRDSVASFHTVLSQVSMDDSIALANINNVRENEPSVDMNEKAYLENSFPHYEASALAGVGIEQVFIDIASNVTPKEVVNSIENITLHDIQEPARTTKCAC
ncbi:Ras- protein Rab-7A [Boothiomyces sp. JEL0838]|nr:Ras- protein Rab-7A [Boothiomyces sp. JEL0838]